MSSTYGQHYRNPHQCRQCSRSFSSRNTLFAHITEQNHWADVKDTGGGKTPYGAKLDDHPPNSNHDAAAAAGAKLHNRIPSKCRQCSRIFSSRNALFAHINEQNHWTNDDGGKGRVIQEQHRCGNCQRIFPSRGQLDDHWKAKHLPLTDQSVCNSGRAEGIDTTVSELGAHDDIYSGESPKGSIDEASEFDSEAYSGDEEERSDIDYGDPQLPPPKLSIYTKPFPGIENKDRKQRWQKFNAATNWDERYAIAVDMLLEPYLTKYKNVFSFWPQQELRTIFDDAVALPKLPTDPTRYFYNEFQTTISDDIECEHSDECWCYLETTTEAGIRNLSAYNSVRKDRDRCIAFMHGLLAQFLIILAQPIYKSLNDNEDKLDLREAVQWALEGVSPPGDFLLDSETERQKYLDYDDTFLNFCDGCGFTDLSECELAGMQLLGTVGRRALVLAVSCKGVGHLFVKKEPIHYWNVSDLVKVFQSPTMPTNNIERKTLEACIKRNPRQSVDFPRYPTRVIDTRTLEFEPDSIMFRNEYAVLSHTWMQNGLEITYRDVLPALGVIKEKHLRSGVSVLKKRLDKHDKWLDRVKNGDAKRIRKGAAAQYTEEQILGWTNERALYATQLEEMEQKLQDHRNALEKQEEPAMNTESPAEDEKMGPEIYTAEGTSKMRRSKTFDGGEQKFPRPLRANTFTPRKESLDFGMQKLYNALKAARELGYQYLWVDNCCIDKANNTELVEAISSMGDWYYNAAVCLVYIDDYSLGRIDNRFDNEMDIQGFNTRYSSRGWTLQEIVMSSRGVFYDKSWKKRADTAHPWAPMNTLAKLCKVPRSLLCCGGLGKPNVAASIILELAGERRTTRPEDRAYSLMGMLGVRMAPDYGEGQAKALARLFESIISTTGDVSVFNWSGKYVGSREIGRSMYPTDFDGYKGISQRYRESHAIQLATDNPPIDFPHDSIKPAYALESITLDYFGVHARFDICEMEIIVEGNNKATLQAVDRLQKELHQSGKFVDAEDSAFQCEFTFSNGAKITSDVLCPLSALHGLLQNLVHPQPDRASSRSWVMARFASVDASDWFLCEIKHDDQIAQYGLFANVLRSLLQDTEASGPSMAGTINVSSFLRYLETSGLSARRLATNTLPQGSIPNKIEQIKNAYMRIG